MGCRSGVDKAKAHKSVGQMPKTYLGNMSEALRVVQVVFSEDVESPIQHADRICVAKTTASQCEL